MSFQIEYLNANLKSCQVSSSPTISKSTSTGKEKSPGTKSVSLPEATTVKSQKTQKIIALWDKK